MVEQTEITKTRTKLSIVNIYFPLIILGVVSIVWLLVARILWVFGDVEKNNVSYCETHQSSSIYRAQVDGGSGINPIRITSTNDCESFL
jgi:hypothetical protein